MGTTIDTIDTIQEAIDGLRKDVAFNADFAQRAHEGRETALRERDTAKNALGVAQAANQRLERERLVVRNELSAKPEESEVLAAIRVVRERDEARVRCGCADCPTHSPTKAKDGLETITDVTTIRDLLGAHSNERVVDAVRRVVDLLEAVRQARDRALKGVQDALVAHQEAIRATADVRKALGNPTGDLVAHAARVKDESSRYFSEICEVSKVLGERAGSPRYAADVARDVVAERDRLRRELHDNVISQEVMAAIRETLGAKHAENVREAAKRVVAERNAAMADRDDAQAQARYTRGTLNALGRSIFENAKAHGWWTDQATGQALDPVKRVPECLALIHSEVSEALEAYRESDGTLKQLTETPLVFPVLRVDGSPNVGKPVGFPSELADVVIRVLDLCAALGIDIEAAIETKHAYNKTRPMRHGGKLC